MSFFILHPRVPRLFPGKNRLIQNNKQLPNSSFLSAEIQMASAHIMPCDAYSFSRNLENGVRRFFFSECKHIVFAQNLAGAIQH